MNYHPLVYEYQEDADGSQVMLTEIGWDRKVTEFEVIDGGVLRIAYEDGAWAWYAPGAWHWAG